MVVGKSATDTEPQLHIGDSYMVKHPSAGGQWQTTRVIGHPEKTGGVLVEFPDGTKYEPDELEIGGPVNTTGAAPAPGNQPPNPAAGSPLNADYEAFKQIIVQLNGQSRRLFSMPLSVLMVMISRWAMERELEANGQMGSYNGVQTFVPDQDTFLAWVEAYLLEIQGREQGQSPE